MSLLESLLPFFKKNKKKAANQKVDQTCPVCWGYQEYGSTTRLMGRDKQIDVKNHSDKYVKVGKFMVEHVEGFKNKKRIVERCAKCGGKRIIFKEKN